MPDLYVLDHAGVILVSNKAVELAGQGVPCLADFLDLRVHRHILTRRYQNFSPQAQILRVSVNCAALGPSSFTTRKRGSGFAGIDGS